MVEFRTPEELTAHYASVKKRIEERGRIAAKAMMPPPPPKPEPPALPMIKPVLTLAQQLEAIAGDRATHIALKPQRASCAPVIRKERRSQKHTPPVLFEAELPIPRLMWVDVVKAVLEYTGLTLPVLFSARRQKALCQARFLVWTLAYDFCPHLSMPQIGRLSGHKDHTTILHGIRQGPKLQSYEPLYQYLSLMCEQRMKAKMAPEEAIEEFEGVGVA